MTINKKKKVGSIIKKEKKTWQNYQKEEQVRIVNKKKTGYDYQGVPKNTFFEFRFVGRITGANGCPEATKQNFSVIDP